MKATLKMMNKFLAPALAASLAISASTAYAGGPVIVVEEPEVVAEKPASSVGILPLLRQGAAPDLARLLPPRPRNFTYTLITNEGDARGAHCDHDRCRLGELGVPGRAGRARDGPPPRR